MPMGRASVGDVRMRRIKDENSITVQQETHPMSPNGSDAVPTSPNPPSIPAYRHSLRDATEPFSPEKSHKRVACRDE